MGKSNYQIETECINQLAVDGYGLLMNCKVRPNMHRRGMTLIDVKYALANGEVIQSDMLDDRGLWVVAGPLIDGGSVVITVAVRSAEQEVEILAIA